MELDRFSLVATARANKAPQPGTLLLLVHSGSPDHYFDHTIIPGPGNLMFDVEMLETPRKISTAGSNTLLGTRTGALPGTVVDKDGRRHSVKIPGAIVSGVGRHLFSSKKAVEKGTFTIIDSDLPPAAGQTSAAVTTALQRLLSPLLRVDASVSGQSDDYVCKT